MAIYRVKLTGTGRGLLMHADDIVWADYMEAWKNNPDNKKKSKAGDDRSPAWRWTGYCYSDGKKLAIPADNIFASLRAAGASVPVPGQRSKTFKAQSQSGLLLHEAEWPLLIGPKNEPVPVTLLEKLRGEDDFNEHLAEVRKAGFDLLAKRATVGTSKHVRVRPWFKQWTASGTVETIDEQITMQVLEMIFGAAGRFKGLGDWRPGGKTPGQFGTFNVEITRGR